MPSRTVSILMRSCGIERREVVEEDLVAGLFGRLEVDGFDLDQREVLLAFVRRAHVAGDGVAGLEVELADLRGRDVDVVGAGQVVVVGAAKEAVAVGQDLEDALGEDVAFLLALRLKDLEDEVLLAERAGARDLEAAGELAELGNALFFQLGDCHGFSCGLSFFRRDFWCCGDVRCGAETPCSGGGAESVTRGSCEAGENTEVLLEGRLLQYQKRRYQKLRTGGNTVLKTAMAAATALRPRGEPLPRSLQARQSQPHPWACASLKRSSTSLVVS